MNKKQNDYKAILIEEIDEEILEQMPKWFQRLRKAYQKSQK